MRIIQLVYSLCSGGAERFVVSLSNCLAQYGNDVEICMLLDDAADVRVFYKEFLDPRVKFHSMKFTSGFSLSKKIKVESYIKSRRPDVVHCHLNVIPYVYGLALTNNRIRFIHTLHSVAENAAGSKHQYGLNRFYYRSNLIQPVTISLKCQESYKSFYRLDNAPYIDNGCIPVEASSSYEAVVREVESYKQGKSIPVFIHVARFDPQKNQKLLVNAFNRLSKEGNDFVLLVLGSGFQAPNAADLRSEAFPNIRFLGGKKNVGDYLLCSDAFCLTSIYEGLPISLLEALSAGVTPICTPAGGIPDVIQEGETGYLSKDFSLPSYLEAIHKFLDKKLDPERLKQHFSKNYSMNVCMEKYLMVYKRNKI